MKDYPGITKFAIILSVVGIFVCSINWMFGTINGHITDGATVVILASLLTILFVNISFGESEKKKKTK